MTRTPPPSLPCGDSTVLDATREWLEKAVIGLNLCPFAKSVHVKKQIRWVVSDATTPEALLEQLVAELQTLSQADPEQIDTTLLIHPHVLRDFADFNDFLDLADGAVEALNLEGVLQVASFHPDYVFGDVDDPNDISHHTNRSPHPTLHLIREDSIARAIDSLADPDEIYERNIDTLRRMGHEGWKRLWTR